jgi:chromosome segregation ATPase
VKVGYEKKITELAAAYDKQLAERGREITDLKGQLATLHQNLTARTGMLDELRTTLGELSKKQVSLEEVVKNIRRPTPP